MTKTSPQGEPDRLSVPAAAALLIATGIAAAPVLLSLEPLKALAGLLAILGLGQAYFTRTLIRTTIAAVGTVLVIFGVGVLTTAGTGQPDYRPLVAGLVAAGVIAGLAGVTIMFRHRIFGLFAIVASGLTLFSANCLLAALHAQANSVNDEGWTGFGDVLLAMLLATAGFFVAALTAVVVILRSGALRDSATPLSDKANRAQNSTVRKVATWASPSRWYSRRAAVL